MKRGFTLIELVMVIVILGILAATALPRFVDLSNKAKESAAKGSLGAIRAAVAIKYAENVANNPGTGTFPSAVDASLFADSKVPTEPYSNTNEVTAGSGAPSADGVGWRYDNATGQVWINDVDYADY